MIFNKSRILTITIVNKDLCKSYFCVNYKCIHSTAVYNSCHVIQIVINLKLVVATLRTSCDNNTFSYN